MTPKELTTLEKLRTQLAESFETAMYARIEARERPEEETRMNAANPAAVFHCP